MATQTTVIIYDDLDGTEGASRVTFAYRGTGYEIDLAAENQALLGAALAPFIVAARKTGRVPMPADRRTTTPASRRRELAAVRAWAREQGLEVSDRGRVPIEVQKAYDAAH
ncbi:MAG: Lsr2 family protein [Jatrophihabitantaceae bacterium]